METWILLVIFFAIMIGIGIYCRKHTTNVSDFVLGGRSVGPWITAFAYGTTYFSAVVFVGYAGQFGYSFGLSAVWIGIGNAFIGSLLAWVVLGNRTRAMTKHLKAATMPEFFGKRFDSKALKIVASIIVFVFLIPYTASVYNGLSRLFGMALGIDYSICIIAMAALTAVYVILGGYMATAINDFVQGIVMIGGIIAVIIATLNSQGGLFSAIVKLSETPSTTPITEGMQGAFVSFLGPDPLNLIGVVLLTSIGTWGLPQMIHKFYTIKDKRSIKIGTTISTIFAVIISGGCYFLGSFGRLFVTTQDITPANGGKLMYDKIIPQMLETALPDILIGVVVVLVLSASMSTLSSLVLTSSSTLTLDLIKPFFNKDMTEKRQVLIMRILIAFFIILSVIIALNPNTYISTLMSISWGALAGAFLAPFMYGLFWKRVTKQAVWASFISGVGITVIHMCIFSLGLFPNLKLPNIGINLASPINAGAAAMLVGLIIVPIVSLLTRKPDAAKVDEIFTCYANGEA